jgi:proteasome accessory factor B
MSAAKLERLLNLTAALLDTARPLTAAELRRRVPGYPEEGPAFHRAFERDKDDLRELGIPLRRERVIVDGRETDGYRVPPEEYYLRDPGLAPDELAALHLAARVVRLEGVTEALWKLGGEGLRSEGLAPREAEAAGLGRVPAGSGPTEAEGGGLRSGAAGSGPNEEAMPLAEVPSDPRLPAVFAALVDRHPLRFRYASGRSGAVAGEERLVDPWRLDFQRGRWYLSGYDHGRDAARSFRIDRIVGDFDVQQTSRFERPASPHPGVRLQPWELGSEPPVVARLLVDAEQAPWAVQHVGAEAIAERRADGSVVLSLAVVNLDAFRSFVLTFLDHAEVLGPPTLRAGMVEWLVRLAGGAGGAGNRGEARTS